MKIAGCRYIRLNVPFKGSFQHAEASRDSSDTLYVELSDADGYRALGEILARQYVTGETTDSIIEAAGPSLVADLKGATISSLNELHDLVSGLLKEGSGNALVGGVEMAAIGLLSQSSTVDFDDYIGPTRATPVGRCVTIGFEVEFEKLRNAARHALLVGASAVKVKVGGDEDVKRLREVSKQLGGRAHLRLDANGSLSYEGAVDLLEGCGDLVLHSVEQPLSPQEEGLSEKLLDLSSRFGTKFVADESVCTVYDARRWIDSGGYKYFNVRVGKCGGLAASSRMVSLALNAGIRVLGGAMVGESGVLNSASELLLQHCQELPYIEGLGQNKFVLAEDPVESIPVGSGLAFRLRKTLEKSKMISEHHIY